MNELGQLDAPQALQDLEGLRLMLHKVQNEALKLQLVQGLIQCERVIRDIMAQDLDMQPGADCVARLYEAFEEAKLVPAVSAPAPQSAPPLVSANTIYWIAGIGTLAILFASSVGGE